MTFPRSLFLLALLAACGGSDSERAAVPQPANPAAPVPAAASPALPPNARALTPEQRAAMVDILKSEAGTEKKVWFTVGPGNAETQALKAQFEAVFKEAGWETSTQTLTGMTLKPA